MQNTGSFETLRLQEKIPFSQATASPDVAWALSLQLSQRLTIRSKSSSTQLVSITLSERQLGGT